MSSTYFNITVCVYVPMCVIEICHFTACGIETLSYVGT